MQPAARRRFDLIVFDKDGTLIDMTAQAAGWANGIATRMRREGYDESAIGLVYANAGWNPERERCTSTESVLLCGSWKEINACATEVLASTPFPQTGVVLSRAAAGAKVYEWIEEFADALAHKSAPLVDLERLFRNIKATGCQIAVCTADDRRNTDVLFEQFPALTDLVSHVSCADDENEEAVKPNPLLLESIMQKRYKKIVISDARPTSNAT